MGDGGVKNPEKLPTSFMDGPISNDLDPVPWSLTKKKLRQKKYMRRGDKYDTSLHTI